MIPDCVSTSTTSPTRFPISACPTGDSLEKMCIRDRFNDGYITYDELKNAEPIIVSYDAAVSDKAIDGDKVENRAWVNDSEKDIVDGPVIDPDVPSTGGSGTKAFTAAGIALMGAAAGAVIVTGKKKKKEQ